MAPSTIIRTAAVLSAVALALLTSTSALAQDIAEETAPEPSMAEVKDYVARLEKAIAAQEAKAVDLVNSMRTRDMAIESGIDGVVKKLTALTDSNLTKTRVSRIKQDVITRLVKAAQNYQAKRKELEESLRHESNAYTRDDLFKARGAIDARIDRRVEQIVDLSMSFDGEKDLDKYIHTPGGGGGWYFGWDGGWEDNPEYEQNKRASRRGNQTDAKVGEGLDRVISDLETRLRTVESRLAGPDLTPELLKELEAEKKRLQAMIQTRQIQRDALVSGTDEPNTAPLNSVRDAMDLDESIEATAASLRTEVSRLWIDFREWRDVRQHLSLLKARLDFSNNWLKEKGVP